MPSSLEGNETSNIGSETPRQLVFHEDTFVPCYINSDHGVGLRVDSSITVNFLVVDVSIKLFPIYK